MGRRRRSRPWAWVVLGSLVCAGSLLALFLWPSGLAERAAYERARRCADATRDCVQRVPAVVERTRVSRHKADDYYVYLRLEDSAETVQVELPVPDVVFPALDRGRKVTALVWADEVVGVEVPGVGSAETDRSPAVGSLEHLVFGMLGATWGGFAVWNGLAMRHVEASLVGGGRRAVTGRVLVAAAVGAVAGFFQVVSFDVYGLPAYWLTTAGVAAGLWLLLRLGSARRR